MNVSIIYVNYKTPELVRNSIRSVKEKTKGISYEIIVVDNHSEDNSLQAIKDEYPDVICIQAKENLGFGRANNLGIEIAKGECVFFLNPDTLLINNAIEILYRSLSSSDSIGACGGNLYDENHCPTNSFSRKFTSYWQELLSIVYIPPICLKYPRSQFFNHTEKPLDVAVIIGADLMVKREVLDKVGLFDPDFFLNAEESELCYRIKKAGYSIVSFPEAKIIHLEGRASYISKSRLYFLYEGTFIYCNKLKGKTNAKRMYHAIRLKNSIRIFQFRLLFNRKKIDYWKMKQQTLKQAYNTFVKNFKQHNNEKKQSSF